MQKLVEQARRSAKGRIGVVLEGGYDLVALESGLAEGMRAMFEDATFDAELPPAADAPDVERAARVAKEHWKLG
jgi:acetoin utilization deacetylase AcuC-like enzyme